MTIPMKWDLLQMMDENLMDSVRYTIANWAERSHSAATQNRKKWPREIQLLEEECTRFHETQNWLPTELNHRVAREAVKIIEGYNGRLTTTVDRDIHKHVCRCMLEAVLFPGITDWNINSDISEFTKELMILSFPLLPDIKCLRLAHNTPSGCCWLLTNNIQILKNLEEFYFPIGCPRQVLAELGKHCNQLRRLSIMSSKHVDDGSIIHLLKLKNLEFLNVDGTNITPTGYGRIICNLPKLTNVTWTNRVDDVLLSVSQDTFQTVKSLTGTARNALPIVVKCPFVTNLSLFGPKDDLSALKELNAVTAFTLVDCDSDTVNLVEVLQGIGPGLRQLDLSNVSKVSILDVKMCCTHLEILSLDSCEFSETEGKDFDIQLPHFQNLTSLQLRANRLYGDFHSYLRSYVNLKMFTARYTPDLDDTAVESVLQSRGFRKLLEFTAQDCGFLSMKSVILLMENCRNLRLLKGVGKWSGIRKENLPDVYRRARCIGLPVTVVP